MSNLTTSQCRDLMDADLTFKTSTGDMEVGLFLDILNEIEDIYYDMAIYASPQRFFTTTSISTGTNPTTISDLYSLEPDGAGVFDANSDGTISNIRMVKSNRGSSATGYWSEDQADEGGVKMNFTPSTIGTYTKWIVYVPYRTVLTDGDTTIFPSRKSHFIKRALLRYFYLWRQDSAVNIEDAEFQNAIRQIIYNSNPESGTIPNNFSSF